MTTQISESNFQAATLETLSGNPRITQVVVTNSSYVPEGTTVPASGGYLRITGTNFLSGVQVLFDDTPAAGTTRVSSTQLNVQTPILAVGVYFVYVVNPDGGTGLVTAAVTVA